MSAADAITIPPVTVNDLRVLLAGYLSQRDKVRDAYDVAEATDDYDLADALDTDFHEESTQTLEAAFFHIFGEYWQDR